MKTVLPALLLAVLVGNFVGTRLFFESFTLEDKSFRDFAQPSGIFVNGRHGDTYCSIDGPDDGELVVLIHGISISSFTLKYTSIPLNRAGFKTLRYDLYGRGHSASVEGHPYNESLYVEQLEDLLDGLHSMGLLKPSQKKFHLIGYSLGGGIASHYAANHPQEVRSLALLAPVGMPFDMPSTASLLSLPGIELLFSHTPLGRLLFDSHIPVSFFEPDLFKKEIRELEMITYHHSIKDGFLSSFTSTLLNFPGLTQSSLEDEYRRVGNHSLPVMMVWGEDDTTVPASCAKRAKELIPSAELTLIPNCGHALVIEKADLINKRLVSFFSNSTEKM